MVALAAQRAAMEDLVDDVTQPAVGQVSPERATVCFRNRFGDVEEHRPWGEVGVEALAEAAPWRTFRWYQGQKHYSGTFWSATEHGHVIYESRLELARLLFADFDSSVRRIVAQPFLLRAEVDGVGRKHIPDYLLLTGDGPVVVDVKPRGRQSDPKTAFALAWVRTVVDWRGWRFEVFGEPPAAELANIRFLAGYRRSWLFDAAALGQLRARDLDGVTLGDACRCLPERPEPLVRAAVLHLLWRQELLTVLTRPLSAGHVLRRSP
jgi:hypothetical protein